MEKRSILEKAFTVASNSMAFEPASSIDKILAEKVILNEMREYLKEHDVIVEETELLSFVKEKEKEIEKAVLDYK